MNRIIFFNIGWMRDYQGLRDDLIKGGGKHISKEGWGGEIFNFKEHESQFYGYVEAWGKVNINKIGASTEDEFIDNVTVVWTARRPDTGGTYVIGWYENSRVFRERQISAKDSGREFNGQILHFVATAKSSECVLLSIDERTTNVPRGLAGMGQRNVWYGLNNPGFVSLVEKFIANYKANNSEIANSKTPQQFDINKRKRVEEIAVEKVKEYYKGLGYVIKSVEDKNYGWDLEATLNKIKLLIEVKGLSGSDLIADLTPNEYTKLKEKKDTYRLCIVTEALKKPQLFVFSFSTDSDVWKDLTGLILSFTEIVRAQVKIEDQTVNTNNHSIKSK